MKTYALISVAFLTLIGLAVYYTNSPYCLWALILFPTYSKKGDTNN